MNIQSVCALALVALLAPRLQLSASAQGLRPPPDAKQTQPVVDLKSGLVQTASVVTGTVSNISYEYDDVSGPVTIVTLIDVTAHLGSAENTLQIRQTGGPRPDGRFLYWSGMIQFLQDERYLVFLRNTSWNLSPVLNAWAFQVTESSGRSVLVTNAGTAVTGVTEMGFDVSRTNYKTTVRPPMRVEIEEAEVDDEPITTEEFLQAVRAADKKLGGVVGGPFFDLSLGQLTQRSNPVSTFSNPDQRDPKDGEPQPDKP